MGLFDRSPKKPPGGPPAGHVQVPPGHEVRITTAPDSPSVITLDGGAVVASTGQNPMPSIEALGGLLARVEQELATPPRQVLLSAAAGPLSSLFAPADPEVHALDGGAVVWCIGPGFLPWTREPQRCRAVLERIRQSGWIRGAMTPALVCVYLHDSTSPEGRRTAACLRDFGVRPRTPDPSGALLAEVRRPDGATLTALLGALSPGLPSPDSPTAAPPVVLERAFCLRSLALAVSRGEGDDPWGALCRELLAERHALLLLADVDKEKKATISPRRWEGLGEAVGVYFDLESLHRAAADFGKKKGDYGAVSMTARKLFGWALEQPTELALGTFGPGDRLLHVALQRERLEKLQRGEVAPEASGGTAGGFTRRC